MLKQSVFFICLAVLMMSVIDTSSGRATLRGNRVIARCFTDDELTKALISLSREYDEAQAAQRLLQQSSKRSLACRRRIVAAVMDAMDKPDLDISRDQATANLWREGALLLGELKATESLDLLLSHIKMTDGEWSSTMTHQPALAGIVLMGPVAIPKLSNLLRNQDWQIRHYAVFCLASIGGPSARRAIQAAVPLESHPCVKRLMLLSIETIDVKHGGMKQDHGEWTKAFMCMS
jgi:hypothetical protein